MLSHRCITILGRRDQTGSRVAQMNISSKVAKIARKEQLSGLKKNNWIKKDKEKD